jgi:invasion protein IalB
MKFRNAAAVLISLVGGGATALAVGSFFSSSEVTAQSLFPRQQAAPRPAAPKPAAPKEAKAAEPKEAPKPAEPAPQSTLAQATTPGPVRTETITYDAWTVSCRDTPDGKTKKVCSAMLAMVAQQQNQRINLGAWVIARNNEGALVAVVQTPQIDIGVLIGKGVELTLGNGKPRQIGYVNCNPQHCEALMPMDDAAIRESIAANNGAATVKFWKTDGAEFAINIQSIKGIDKAIAAVRS